jgi:predicted nucleotidyltransferase
LQCNLEVNVYDELINKSKDILLHQKYAELYKEYFDGKEKATPPSAKKKKKKKPSAKKEAETNSTNEGSEQLFSNEESIDLRLVFDGEQIEEEYDPSQTASKIVSSTLEYCSYEHKKEVHKNNIIPKSPTIRVKKHTHRIVEKKVVNHQYEEAVKMFSKLTGVAKEKKGDNKSDTTCLSEVSSDSKELKSAEETNFNAHREPGNEYIKIISEGYKLVKPLQYNVRQIEINQTSTAFESEINKFIYNMDSYMGKLDAFRVFCFHLLQKSLFDFYGGNYNIQAHVYGSVASGLALESSDMDIAISGIPINSREQLLSEFVKIKQHLEVIPQIKYIKPIFTAKVPILKLMMQGEVYPAIKVDLLIPDNEELPSHLLRCLHSVNMTKDILSKFKHTREIVIILKKLLNIRNFNSPYTGKLMMQVASHRMHWS